MSVEVRLRPLVQGELGQAWEDDAPYDDFGPRGGFATPPPCRLDDQGVLGVEADGELAGVVSWIWQRWGPNDASRNPMLGVRLLAEHRGRGIGTTAQWQLIDQFFRHTTAHRVEAGTDIENLAEQHVLEKLGMTRDGISRGAQWRDGGWRDVCLYSVLRSEWLDRA
jgi:RimJ/RimL family protein N-acetyltransferase